MPSNDLFVRWTQSKPLTLHWCIRFFLALCSMLHLQPLLEQSLEPVEYLYFMKGLPLKSCSNAANFISLSKSIHLCSSYKNSKNHNNSGSYKLIPIARIQVTNMITQTVTRIKKTTIISCWLLRLSPNCMKY